MAYRRLILILLVALILIFSDKQLVEDFSIQMSQGVRTDLASTLSRVGVTKDPKTGELHIEQIDQVSHLKTSR